MSKDYDAMANIRFFSEEEGGRRKPLPPRHFSCLLYHEGSNYDCRILLEGLGTVQPGQTIQAPIKFLDPESAKGVIKAGDKFELREFKVIAEGILLAISIGD